VNPSLVTSRTVAANGALLLLPPPELPWAGVTTTAGGALKPVPKATLTVDWPLLWAAGRVSDRRQGVSVTSGRVCQRGCSLHAGSHLPPPAGIDATPCCAPARPAGGGVGGGVGSGAGVGLSIWEGLKVMKIASGRRVVVFLIRVRAMSTPAPVLALELALSVHTVKRTHASWGAP
jgi:hypothetical protein